jgi:hypothetical protein
MKKFLSRFFWLETTPDYLKRQGVRGYSWKGSLGLWGFACNQNGGVYHNGRHWIVFCNLDRFGFNFRYEGDQVVWLWPWKRRDGRPFADVSLSYSTFESLEAISDFWKRYWIDAETRFLPAMPYN